MAAEPIDFPQAELADTWSGAARMPDCYEIQWVTDRSAGALRRFCGAVWGQLDSWYTHACLNNPPVKARPGRAATPASVCWPMPRSAVLAKGFAATSIDEIIAAVGITKSGFFYHFKDKSDLAKALMLRYLAHDKTVLDDLFRRADELNEDPLHGFLVGLKLFAEMMAELPEAHPGCLAASFCYQDQLFNREINKLNADGLLSWRQRFGERLAKIASIIRRASRSISRSLADMAATLVEGGLILGRVLQRCRQSCHGRCCSIAILCARPLRRRDNHPLTRFSTLTKSS